MTFKPPVGQRAGQQTSTVVRQVGVLEARYTFDAWRWLDYDNIPDLYRTPPGGDPLDPGIVQKLDPAFPSLAPVTAYCALQAAQQGSTQLGFPDLLLARFGGRDVLDGGPITAPPLPPLVIIPPPPPTT